MRLGKVQQKECTGHAVVKPGKLYVVQCHVNQCLRAARSMLEGRQLKCIGNNARREMIRTLLEYRIRLIDLLKHKKPF